MKQALSRIYQRFVLGHPKSVLAALAILLLFFSYHAKEFKLDASADSLLLEDDKDLELYRTIAERYAIRDFLVVTFLFLLGASPYLLLPLRAAQNPLLNWENPVNWQNFWHLVSGRIYRASYLAGDALSIVEKLAQGSSLFLEQFGLLGLLLGFAGVVLLFQKSRFCFLTLWISLFSWGVFLVYQAPSAHLYLLPFFFAIF